jgi:hypothetical protein
MRTSSFVGSFVLATATLMAAAVGACGPGEAPGPTVPSSTPSATTPSTPSTPGTTPPTPSSTASTPPSTSGTAVTPPPAAGPMKNIKGSAMADELKALGFDLKKLPPLGQNKIEADKLRKLMQTFKKALGVECTACHDANDFRLPTPNKKVATHMWNDWVKGYAMEDGSPVYCDSCHQGSMKFLDKHDKKALSTWMDANFVSKLKRQDKKEQACETCHGDPFDPKFLSKWEK